MAPQPDELSVDLTNVAQQAIDAAKAELATETASDTVTEPSSSASEVEIPESDFWNDSLSDSSEQTSQPTAKDDLSQSDKPSFSGTITYKANGKEVEVSLEEAKKQLSLVAGARKAFSDKARIQRELAQLKRQQEEMAKYKSSWDKLEALKDEPERLVELLFNKPYEEFEKEVYTRRRAYEDASPEEQRYFEYEARIRNLERENKRMQNFIEQRTKEAELKEQQIEQKREEAEKQHLQNMLEKEFYKHKVVDVDDPLTANKLKKMLWRQSLADLRDLSAEVPLKPSVIAKVFSDNAKALAKFKSDVVNSELKSISSKRKEAATKKAQLAGTANYSQQIDPEILKLDPVKLLQFWRSRR